MNTKRIALAVIGAALVALLAYVFLKSDSKPPDPKSNELSDHSMPPKSVERTAVDDVVSTSAASTEERLVAASAQTNKNLFRSNYERSPDLPDGVAFWTVMQKINMWATSKPNLALAWIRTELRLSSSEASAFLTHLQATYGSYTKELNESSEQLACSDQVKHTGRDELYSTLEKLDDLNYELAEKHLTRLKAEVGDEIAGRFQEALDNSKLGISHSTVRQDVAHETQARDPLQSINIICNQLRQN